MKIEKLKQIFENEVNNPVIDLNYDEGSIVFDTMPGSSLIPEIQEALTNHNLEKEFDIENIEFIDYGDQHEYIINKI